MNKLDLFVRALKEEHYVERLWCLRVMSVPVNNFIDKRPYHPCFEDGRWYTFTDEGVEENLEGVNPGMPLFEKYESIYLEPGDLPNVLVRTKTAYSSALINAILFVWPFKTPLPYVATTIKGSQLDDIIEDAIRTGKISIEERTGRFTQATGRLTAFTQTAITAATPKSIRPSKRALAARDALLAKYKGQLDDPVILALIDETVTKIDKEDMSDDEAAKFFLKGKAYAVVRKKMFTIQGGISKMDGPKMDLLPTSLEEGLRPEDMPAAVNDLRIGTMSRAKDTAFGGEAAKFANRVFQNIKIVSDDCESKIGFPLTVSARNYKKYNGRFLLGKEEPLTTASLKTMIGKTILIRSPATCKEKGRNFCKRCMGRNVAESGVKLGAQLGAVGNVFMSVSLAAFHGGALTTVQAIAKDHMR